ncbi:hypothetical protein A2W48_01160 [Candidatus Giovannonibacteria bacterium RIFCSPHIGHO2_12_44_12]|uniref:Uncharacterized protein n=2 Tax=Candidatus Giovannoniibacteriota TaxID=1752738 RepID=A0A1F5WYJ3_9BACT|nr:MAG: hypothetical protein A2W48_01160 [Candidatus Giovannonibacteria bacterium RIFCSPHIGHO2_12_44_12]OGF85700.1 MAG: hypothetical protein A2Z63_01005 [Candidatus Giovannonibacteria bacterium RIFCSPLOWO2_02_44_8]
MDEKINKTETIESGEALASGQIAHASKAEVKSLAEKQNLLLWIMGGIVVVVVITFWMETNNMHINYVQDKSILLQNNQLNKDYFDKVLFLNNEVKDLKTQIEVLRARNPYLK